LDLSEGHDDGVGERTAQEVMWEAQVAEGCERGHHDPHQGVCHGQARYEAVCDRLQLPIAHNSHQHEEVADTRDCTHDHLRWYVNLACLVHYLWGGAGLLSAVLLAHFVWRVMTVEK